MTVDVPLETVFKTTGPMPRAFLKGFGAGYWDEDDKTLHIVGEPMATILGLNK